MKNVGLYPESKGEPLKKLSSQEMISDKAFTPFFPPLQLCHMLENDFSTDPNNMETVSKLDASFLVKRVEWQNLNGGLQL